MADAIEQAAFTAWQQAHASIFHLMLAYKCGLPDTLQRAAEILQHAADTARAALPEDDEQTPESSAAPCVAVNVQRMEDVAEVWVQVPEPTSAASCHLRPVIEAHRIAQEGL